MSERHTSAGEMSNLNGFVCECRDARCQMVVRLTIEEYDEVRERGGFVLAPGHRVLPATGRRDAA
jgi:hypothetical protein